MLRDWTDSSKFDGLSANSERLFTRLIMKADDYGRFHADPRLVKSNCFPLNDIECNDVSDWLEELEGHCLIVRYQMLNRNLLSIVNYGQRLKKSRAKFPQMEGKPDDWRPTDDSFRELPGDSGNFLPEEKRREVEEKMKGENPLPFVSEELSQLWDSWFKHRREIGHPQTPESCKQQVAKLKLWGLDKSIQALKNALAGGWQGIFEPKGDTMKKQFNPKNTLGGPSCKIRL